MNFPGALLGGIIGAVISSAIWIAIGYYLNLELGILAVGVGLACGIGVAAGAKGHTGGAPGGMLAAALAFLAIIAARFIIVQMDVEDTLREAAAEIEDIPGPEDSVYWTNFIAQRIESDASYDDYQWPDEEAYEDDFLANDYPIEIWNDASQQWGGLSVIEKEQFCAQAKQEMSEDFQGSEDDARLILKLVNNLFANLAPMALVIMGIAVAGAYRVAATARPSGDPSAGLDSYDDSGPTGLPGMPAPTAPVPSSATRTMEPPSSTFGLPGMPPPSSARPTGLPGMPPPSAAARPTGLPGMPPPSDNQPMGLPGMPPPGSTGQGPRKQA